MFTLRLTQHAEAEAEHYRVEVALEGDGARQVAVARFPFKLSEQDQEDLRWYLEDYLQQPFEPESQIAARVEQRLRDVGIDLFKAVFQADDDARDLWATFRHIVHNQLGNIYDDAGDLNRALHHWREAIRYDEAGGNLYEAGKHRCNIAIALTNADRRTDALAYAREALRNYETYGEGAAEEIGKTRRLIEWIEGLNR